MLNFSFLHISSVIFLYSFFSFRISDSLPSPYLNLYNVLIFLLLPFAHYILFALHPSATSLLFVVYSFLHFLYSPPQGGFLSSEEVNMCMLTLPSLTRMYPFSFEMPILHFREIHKWYSVGSDLWDFCLLIVGYMYLYVYKHIIESILKGNYSVLKIKGDHGV